ncbi:MAG: exonuclease [Chitinophagales bacterium]|nr:MAG: exonuclease [Chitinophagales bacterium]
MFAVVDTETTGGNPVKDRLMEIAILLHDGEKVVEEFSTLVNPGVPISPFIVSLTGITDEMVAQAPTFADIADTVKRMTEKSIFVAHNARFDYAILRREFKRLNERFQRKQLCTVHLSQVLLPGKKSYSLGKLCREMGIPVQKRHRALGDAKATVSLFELLLRTGRDYILRSVFSDELEGADLPTHLPLETVDDLPEETGVYYLLDNHLQVLYIGRARNIRKRVIEQITKELVNEYESLKDHIYDVHYELTGSELVAQLLELEEIRRLTPRFNFTRRKKEYRYGIYERTDAKGFMSLHIERLNSQEAAVVETVSYSAAARLLRKLAADYLLDPCLCGLAKSNGIPMLSPEVYNKRVSQALRKYRFDHPNFFILSEGRSHHDQSVIWVENNIYRGFGYIEPENIENDLQSLKDCVKPYPSSPEAIRIIRNWMRKRSRDELIRY